MGHLDQPTRRNVPSTGSVMLRLQGTGFGQASYTAKTRIGATMQENSGGWISDSSILCQAPATGLLASVKQIMTVGKRSGSISESITYSVGDTSTLTRKNQAGTGSISLTVAGAGLGQFEYTTSLRTSKTGCEATEWESETTARCLTGTGAQGTRQVIMTAGEQEGTFTQSWSADTAGLSMMSNINREATGATTLTVHGASMGLVTYTGRAREGHTGCEATYWESETAVWCLAGHGVRGTRRLLFTAGQACGSISQAWSIDSPSLYSLLTERSIGWYLCWSLYKY